MRKLIIYADGGARGNPGPAGAGAAVLSVQGEVLAEVSLYLGHATNNVAEYAALIGGLEAAQRLDAKASVEIRMDSELVIKQMKGLYKVKHPNLKPLYAQAKDLASAFEDISFSHVPREKNTLADALANDAMDRGA